MSGEVSGIAAQGALSAQLIRIQTEQPGVEAVSPPVQATQEAAQEPPPVESGRGQTVDRTV